MSRPAMRGLDRRRLRFWLLLFFLSLAIPTGLLIHQAYRQLKWEAFHQHRVLAEELASRIDGELSQLIERQEARSFADFGFLVVVGDPSANFVQRSPLSAFPVEPALPGLIGYFQIDSAGGFATPLLPQQGSDPAAFGISAAELADRSLLQERIRGILSQNRLVGSDAIGAEDQRPATLRPRAESDSMERVLPPPARDAATSLSLSKATAPAEEGLASQAAFDELRQTSVERKKRQDADTRLGRVEDLQLDYSYQADLSENAAAAPRSGEQNFFPKRSVRKERTTLPEAQPSSALREQEAGAREIPAIRIRTFESEIDPFEFSLLDSGDFVLFRKVWRDGQRYIQGALVESQPLLRGTVETPFRKSALSGMSDLLVAYQGAVLDVFSGQKPRAYPPEAEELSGALLYQMRLSSPLSALEVVFTVNRLPSGPGGTLLAWVAVTLALVLCGGFVLMYRLGLRQIGLARQQQDFVSAVSHELKTPITAIRMYGEMLREGWASEEKKRTYYDYIYEESERLSRLINNVLQLARMSRSELRVERSPVRVADLIRDLRPKIASQIERAGFCLRLDCAEQALAADISVDSDGFLQIVINLVDNAIKFAARAEPKEIAIRCRRLENRQVVFSVRDYGPGVPRDQRRKIFKLFYRSENELTRETVGTGIGLALVQQLTVAMGGRVEVVDRQPGAEFRVFFPLA